MQMSYYSPTLKFSPPSDISVSRLLRAAKKDFKLHFSSVSFIKLSEYRFNGSTFSRRVP